MKTVCINTYQRRPGIFKAVENDNLIPVPVRRSIYAQWQLGHYPREIGKKYGLGDNVVCDIVREAQSDDFSRSLQAAEWRGRLTQWPVGGLRRAA